jgi:hypothetical protein
MLAGCDATWSQIGQREHLVQFYQEPGSLLESLEAFVAGGLRGGEGVIVIATPAHLFALEGRLADNGFDLLDAEIRGQYIARDAEDTLSRFMINDRPDEELFERMVSDLLERAGDGGRKVRAFGEMVALLWADGNREATLRLEQMWHKLCRRESFSLLCAYPRESFGVDAGESIRGICGAHSKVMA